LDQRSIELYLSIKGISAKAMNQELVQRLGAEAGAYPTVTSYFRAAKFPAQIQEARDETGVARIGSVDAAILKALTHNPFSSIRELSPLI
jgi:hypothetical protein